MAVLAVIALQSEPQLAWAVAGLVAAPFVLFGAQLLFALPIAAYDELRAPALRTADVLA